jgi:glycosyltransferase involved in cell wall biosynthesis
MPDALCISVVIPCFNYAQYVAGAIESALGQSYAHKQIVVVNDGSSDDSLGVISRYRDHVLLIDQPNQGSIAAYQRGFAATSGGLILFLDADDQLEPHSLSRIAAAWSPGCAKVQYDLRIIDGAGKDLGRRFCHFTPGYDAARVRAQFRRTGTYRWPVTVGNAYSRWFLERLLPLDIEHGPDGSLNTVAPVYGEVVTIAEPLAAYRIHGANMWTSDGSDWRRLPQRIAHRRREEVLLRRHAAERGVSVPEQSILDHELAFINYRLMARKLGLEYEGHDRESTLALLQQACRVLAAERLPPASSAAHLLWFSALALAPRSAAQRLVQLRFNRHQLRPLLQRRLQAGWQRLQARAKAQPA